MRVARSTFRLAVRAGRPVLDSPAVPLSLQRWIVDQGGGLAAPVPAVRTHASALGGVPGTWVEPAGEANGAMLYPHGGGYVVGSDRSHSGFVAHLVRATGARAFVPHAVNATSRRVRRGRARSRRVVTTPTTNPGRSGRAQYDPPA